MSSYVGKGFLIAVEESGSAGFPICVEESPGQSQSGF